MMQHQWSVTQSLREVAESSTLLLPRLPSVDMIFPLRSISVENHTRSDLIDPLPGNARNAGVLATLQSTVAPQLDALYVHNLVTAAQTAPQNFVHMAILVAHTVYFIGVALPTNLNQK